MTRTQRVPPELLRVHAHDLTIYLQYPASSHSDPWGTDSVPASSVLFPRGSEHPGSVLSAELVNVG